MEERVRLSTRCLRSSSRVLDIGAAMSLEVGKNRMEALGEVQETADFFNLYADDFAGQTDSIILCPTIRFRISVRTIAA